MALAAKLQFRQSQSLVMTPQLLQSIRLLQYGHGELKTFLEAEIERNPLLSMAPAKPLSKSIQAVDGPQPGEGSAMPSRSERYGGTSGSGQRFDGLDTGFANVADTNISLLGHALAEARDIAGSNDTRTIAEAFADELDENGYCRCDPAEFAIANGFDPDRTTEVLLKLQAEAAPAGLFARNLKDCMAIQLKRRNRYDPIIAKVIDNLELLANRDFAALRRLTGEDDHGLLDILAEIKSLDPKPGHAFDGRGGEGIEPDVLISADGEGGWVVELNPATLPRVLTDRTYLKRVRKHAATEEERSFLSECLQSASWLERALESRAQTIMKVAEEIVKRQGGFLVEGISGMKPMTLAAVADAIGMHESTVSRVTNMKFVATPRGVFEMRFFFTRAIAAANGGDAHSAESVKLRIKRLIDAEVPGKVLSDDEIAAILKKEGIDLARRTVAKYREAQSIPSSIQRRRELNARRLAS
ncbi:DNA-directed RNA polymerase subunit N [Fulvimarina pelagi HTCC2506]|uniref:RNA polymerase sigma-54 factor n=1 Tax=Fulvimarina pelagi HTCC2506 TaxID=314231 RepID=Q0G1W5_9HYPH|nr:RNA polymerase factor sigma-54 [Fulvimarina pelagi]EAU41433.1 DNA-directed RNA polymerase subunit N [Fulvimarina pelagi HTCC2506]